MDSIIKTQWSRWLFIIIVVYECDWSNSLYLERIVLYVIHITPFKLIKAWLWMTMSKTHSTHWSPLIALIYLYIRNSLLEIEVNIKCVIKHSVPQVKEREQAAWLVFNGKCFKLYLITAREQCVCAIHSVLIHWNCNCNVPKPSKNKGSYNWKI